MIWDRWDDAMDDLQDEAHQLEQAIRELTRDLRALGVRVPPPETRPASPTYPTDSWADRAHRERWDDVEALRGYRDSLQTLLEAARRR